MSGPGGAPDAIEALGRLNGLLDEWVRLTRTALTLPPDDTEGIGAILDRREQLMPAIAGMAAAVEAADADGGEPLARERERCIELGGLAAGLDSELAGLMAARLKGIGEELGRARAARRLGRACGGREEAAGARFLDQKT